MLEVINLFCQRGERVLFANVSFSLAAGECLHVRGSNGSGKTSLLRLMVGLAPIELNEAATTHPNTPASIRWRGESLVDSVMREDLIYLGHHAAVNGDLTALENLHFANAQDGVPLAPVDALAALRRMGLGGREDLPTRVLSAGQRRRVLLARLLTRRAKLWVLDEAFTALDVAAVKLLGELLGEHLSAGGLAVLTSHQTLPVTNAQVLEL